MIASMIAGGDEGDAFQHTLQPKMLRAYFAAQAMQGILASGRVHVDIRYDDLAREAARHADALLTELEKGK